MPITHYPWKGVQINKLRCRAVDYKIKTHNAEGWVLYHRGFGYIACGHRVFIGSCRDHISLIERMYM